MATKEQLTQIINSLIGMEEEIDDFLTEKFADLEIALDEYGLKDIPYIFKIWDRVSDQQFNIKKDLKQLRQTLQKAINSQQSMTNSLKNR